MPKLTINDQEIEVEAGTSILQAAEQLGVEIPRFCYHDKLSVPANCRMCLVELEGAPKPVASCALAAGDGMVVKTDSEMTKKARKGVMEMLLINHPLDCPICDQGGECDLQDQAMAYGFDRSRFHENKRAVPDKELGPLIKTIMTRCINCTRCVRFGEEIAGMTELGQLNRGEDAEIGTFIEKAVTTELSGNMIDVCPVGALTSKPYAFKSRPWELRKTETIDVHDAVGSNIRVDARGNEVMRVLPRLNEEINEEWINDRTRFAYDGLKYRRLDRPYIRDEKSGKLAEASWEQAFTFAAEKIGKAKPDQIGAFVGDLCDVESMFALRDLMRYLGVSNIDCRVDGMKINAASRGNYLFNTTISGIEEADAVLLVGTNPRWEATMVNARIRKAYVENNTKIGVIGPQVDLTYPYDHLGAGPSDLEKLIKARSGFAKILKDAKNPMIILGAGALCREDGEAVQALAMEAAEKFGMIQEGWNGFNILHKDASRVGALDLGFVPEQEFDVKDLALVYLLGVDHSEFISKIDDKSFVVYQGHHGDAGASRADLILPGAAYTEKDGIYVNTEGRPQLAKRAAHPVGDAKEDWKILRALSDYIGKTLPYNDLLSLRARLFEMHPHLQHFDEIQDGAISKFELKNKILSKDFDCPVQNFYDTNVITHASKVMQDCTKTLLEKDQALLEAAE